MGTASPLYHTPALDSMSYFIKRVENCSKKGKEKKKGGRHKDYPIDNEDINNSNIET